MVMNMLLISLHMIPYGYNICQLVSLLCNLST
jgi:hypothetical protein